MILAIDIGNTGIILGFYDKDQLKANFKVSSVPQRTADEYAMLLRLWCSQRRLDGSVEG
ncbi:MAG: type III pantothenate kinase, partial [Lachnospiraceae bacterium]|nr:type III pantothenate kinase [Lachnospiraceae bacterium]